MKSQNYVKITLLGILAVTVIFSFSYQEAFAVYTPTQPNALASYNSDTNEIQVEWDFTTGGADAPETCLLKGDFWFMTDANNAYDISQLESDDPNHLYYDHVTRITGFTPIHYSVVSSNPTIVGPDKITEVIPCTGNTRINLNTMMSHPSNVKLDGVTPRLDLQIFLSFYALDANTLVTLETFTHEPETFMDQIFVFYTPSVTLSTAAKNYACIDEIGNVLYLDQSGIHGNNGDNCNEYLVLNTNQYVDIGGANNAAPLADGEIAYGLHSESSFSLLTQVSISDPTQTKKKTGGGGNEWKTKPTFGLSHETYKRIVDNGFSFNYESYMITDNRHTDFNMTEIKVGDTVTFTLKGYFQNVMKWMGISLGIPKVGESQLAEFKVIAIYDYQGNQTGYLIEQKSNVIDPESLIISNQKVKCQESDSIERCDEVKFTMTFLEPLKDHVSGMYGVDQQRRSQWTFLNEGFDVTGDSLNPMKVYDVHTSVKYEGLVTCTLQSKYSNICNAEDGRTFEKNSYDSFREINRTFEKTPSPEQSVMTRVHTEYYKIIDYEISRAETILNEFCPHCNDTPFEELDEMVESQLIIILQRSEDPVLQKAIILEQQRATEILNQMK